MEAIVPDLLGIDSNEREKEPPEEIGAMPIKEAADPSTPPIESRDDASEVPRHPGKAPVMSP